jgi:hypothetical protein
MTNQNSPTGQITFVASYQPGLPDGGYQVSASQVVSAPGATVPPAVHRMVVSGPRFTLDPADVHAQYPPAAASGAFARVLPHVVFTKRLLPWERLLPTGDPAIPSSQGTPWLALLNFSPGELLISDNAEPATAAIAGYAVTMTVAELLAQGSASVRVPELSPETADEAALKCQVISVTSATFADLVPTRRELPFLAHGRDVAVAGKVLLDMPDPGKFSVVVANRFPLPGTATAGAQCVAHLVSLEGFGDLLNGSAPVHPSQSTVKLVSLLSWTFGCVQDPAQTFVGLARNLAFDGATPRPPQSLLLRLPFIPAGGTDPATATANSRLGDGYLALGYHTRAGDDGFAWYRGPLAPSVTRPPFTAGTFPTADAAMIFDPGTGVFDLSLAAAWQCGRSLALAGQAYAAALMRLRQQARTTLDQLTVGNADLPGGTGPAHPALAGLIQARALEQIAAASTGRVLARPRRARARAAPPPAPVHRLRALLAGQPVKATLTGSLAGNQDAAIVADWLGQLSLLEGIPFHHLVPDARMLPPESIRFGYLDQGWITAMINGALAIGLGTSEESSVQAALTAELTAMAAQSALAARATALGLPVPTAPTGPTSAVLIRSALVAGWPGIVVRATLAGAEVPLLRFDTVQPDVLVAVFAGVPDSVQIEEPHEGLAFGVTETGQIVTRTIAGSGIVDGVPVQIYDPAAPSTAYVSLRQGGSRVLNVNSDPAYPSTRPPGTPADLLGLIAHGLNTGTATITPATFALQMIEGPEQLTFSLQSSASRQG